MATSELFKDLVAVTRRDRAKVRRLVARGRWREPEPDRLALFSPENELDYALVAIGDA